MRTLRLAPSFLCALFTFAVLSAHAQDTFEVPALTGPVVDAAGVIDGSREQAIATALRAIHDAGGSQINVLTVRSLGGLPIEQASIQVVDKWKLGGRKTDNGVLLLVAAEDRKLRIEVGQGREGVLTDADSKRIIEESIVPLFKAGDMGGGILVGVYQIAKKTDPTIDITPYLEGQAVRRVSERGHSRLGPGFIIFLVILFLFFRMIGGGRRRRGFYGGGFGGGGWGGGGFGGGGFGGGGGGGGSWGGGGGGFSGGGASGGW